MSGRKERRGNDTPTHPNHPHDRRGTSGDNPVQARRGCIRADGGNVRTLDIDSGECPMKRRMTIVVSRNGIGILFRCFRLPDYGKRCDERDDGDHCMKCKYCKAELSGFDATRLLNFYGRHNDVRICEDTEHL